MTLTRPYQQTRWSLDPLIPGGPGPELEAALKRLEEKVSEFETLRASLRDDLPENEFLDIIRRLEQMTYDANIIYSFAGLYFAENTQNQTAQTLIGRVDQFMAEMSNRTLFFSLWWKALPEAQAARLMANSGDYRYWLEEMRHFKDYTLSEPEEKIINTKNVTGASAIQNLYSALTNRYVFKVEIEGEVKELTRGELMSYARHYNPDYRAAAYRELYRVYGEDGDILGQMYQALVRDWRNEQVKMRGFKSPIAARNLMNDLPDEVIDTLMEVARKNVGVFQRFFKLKARLLGMDRLRRYDIYAPVAKSEKPFAYPQAADLVLESFGQFHPRFAELAERVFAENRLDAEVRKGKRGGAFCATAVPGMTPWVLLNYQGKADDVATMAHELGHAIHSMLAAGHSVFTHHACLPLAETASTFGEMMLIDRLLAEESDPAVRRDLLFRQVDDAYATIQRQIFFALFEKQAHEMIHDGASVDELCAAYFQNLQEQFGDAVEVDEAFKWEWVSIPHIYEVPFYVYAYAFGQLLVLSLYQQYKQEGEAFKPRYIRLLEAGGSIAPMEILDQAGVDVRKAEFWQGGFNVIAGLVDQLEKL